MKALAILIGLAAGLAQAQGTAARVELQGDAIVFEGRIDEAAATTFLQLLDTPGVRRLVITSPGGLVSPALDMAEALHARGLDVEVPRACHSSCASYIFPAGRRKLLGTPVAVGWHGNMRYVLHLQRTGQRQWSAGEMDMARALAQREDAFFRRVGVDGFVCWFGKLPPYDVDEFYALAPEHMALFGITGVTLREQGIPPGAPGAAVVLTIDRAGVEATRAEVLRSEQKR